MAKKRSPRQTVTMLGKDTTTDKVPKPECIVPPFLNLHFNHWLLDPFELVT